MKEIAEVLRVILDKFLGFFGIFDLSFFVSGGAFVLAVTYLFRALNLGLPVPLSDYVLGFAAVLVIYLCGLVNFGVGRYIRRTLAGPWGYESGLPGWRKVSLGGTVRQTMLQHHLDTEPRFAQYFAPVTPKFTPAAAPKAVKTAAKGTNRPWSVRPQSDEEREGDQRFTQLYTRLWAEIRQRDTLEPSFTHINSYWVRAAVYDGLVVSIAAWMVAASLAAVAPAFAPQVLAPPPAATAIHVSEDNSQVGERPALAPQHRLAVLAATILFGPVGVWACIREARRCDQYQLVELIGTIAWERDQRERAREEMAYRAERMSLDRTLSSALHELIPPYVERIGEQVLTKLQEDWIHERLHGLVRDIDITERELRRVVEPALRPIDPRVRQAAYLAAYGALRHSALQAIADWCVENPSPDSDGYQDAPEAWMQHMERALSEGKNALDREDEVLMRAARSPSLIDTYRVAAVRQAEQAIATYQDRERG